MTDTSAITAKGRISSIDLMRGIVMVIMALDHVRDFFHVSAFTMDPTDPAHTTPALFFTRWITHFCAPTFVFLSGTSMRLSLQRKSRKELSHFLWTRGAWLLFLEFTIVRFGVMANLYYDFTMVQVIYTIGASMIVMSGLLYLKDQTLFILGVVIVAGHNLLDYAVVQQGGIGYIIAALVYQGGPLFLGPGKVFGIFYPFLPWLGIMLLGYSLGHWYVKGFDPQRRQRLLMRTGWSAILLFVALRAINVYGDPAPWQVQSDAVRTFLSFLNCTKYPVSLLYTLMTLGPVLVLLSFMEKTSMSRLKPLEVFGRVPMFYYLIHFYLIHLIAFAAFFVIRHKGISDLNFHFDAATFFTGPTYFGGLPVGWGFGLVGVYFVWLLVILIMYPLCVRYNQYKSTHRQWWLSYL